MPSSKPSNIVLIASAGSRKTTGLVEDALALKDRKVLLTTYTNENVDQIRAYLIDRAGHIPKNVTVLSWFSFLLTHGVRPYQNHLTGKPRITTIDFLNPPNRYNAKAITDSYYLNRSGNIYRDKVSEFVCECDDKSGGLVVGRLNQVFDAILIDELQDFAGYDFTFLEKLMVSPIRIVAVGDPRQATFSTNRSSKNKQFRKSGIAGWIEAGERKGLFSVEQKVECFRCNQQICDFADALFPKLPRTVSQNVERTGHDGVFHISAEDVADYCSTFRPLILRYSKTTNTLDLPAFNIGMMKGKTFDRVLIFPTEPMKKYLDTNDVTKAGDLSKLYVAVTRARFSVAFVT